MGFGVPLADWFRGSLREFSGITFPDRRFLRPRHRLAEFARQLLEEHQSGRRNNNHWLWSLLMLELWLEDLETGCRRRLAWLTAGRCCC